LKAQNAVKLGHKKYGFKAKLVGVFKKEDQIVIAIQI